MHIENNTLLIVPNSLKKNIIKNIKELVNYKVMSLDEFIKKYYFDFNEESICFLMKEKDIKYDVANAYLKNIYYVENKEYNNKKLDDLVQIKKLLEDNNLLIKNDLFKKSLTNKKIIVYGYSYIEKPYRKLLDSLGATYIEDSKEYSNQELYEFTTSEEEIDFIISKIVELIDKGVSLNNIKIVKSEYDDKIKDKLKLYDINIPIKINLYGTNIIKLFLSNLTDIEKSLDNIKNNINLVGTNLDIYNKLVNILNKYTFIDDKESIKEVLINEFKNSNIIINYKEQIEFINLEDNVEDNYVFLPEFNMGIYPHIIKDEEYITDNIKELVNLETTNIINKKIKEYLINKIKCTNNLVLTYHTEEDKYFVSSLNDELKLKAITNYKIPYYINLDNKIKLAKKLDIYRKYNEKDDDLELLYSNYNIKYNSYDNSFSGIKRKVNHIKLSYTSMNEYYECSFRYYLNRILDLNIYEERFTTYIGDLFHKVLQEVYENNINFEKVYDEEISKKEFTSKEKFFLEELKEELRYIINNINEQLKIISLDKALYEKEVTIEKPKVTFTGKIDKLLYGVKDGIIYTVIIDYKTGNIDLNLNNIIYGLDMQLPVYLYLTKNIDEFKDSEILGFYLQKLINGEIKSKLKTTYEDQRKENLKLQGYSIDNQEKLELFDSSYINSKLIKGIKLTTKGNMDSRAKLLNENKIKKIIDLVEEKIDNATNDIIDNKYDINPKYFDQNKYSCKFCKYKDICYRKSSDMKYLEKCKNLDL